MILTRAGKITWQGVILRVSNCDDVDLTSGTSGIRGGRSGKNDETQTRVVHYPRLYCIPPSCSQAEYVEETLLSVIGKGCASRSTSSWKAAQQTELYRSLRKDGKTCSFLVQAARLRRMTDGFTTLLWVARVLVDVMNSCRSRYSRQEVQSQ